MSGEDRKLAPGLGDVLTDGRCDSPVRVLLVDDDDELCRVLERRLRKAGYVVGLAPEAHRALEMMQSESYDLALVDVFMPGMNGLDLLRDLKIANPDVEAVIITGQGSIDAAIQALKLGAFDYLQKPCTFDHLIVTLKRAYEHARLRRENIAYRSMASRGAPDAEIIGQSPAIEAVRRLIARCAPTHSSVLIDGASGTGKELVARAIWAGSPLHDKPFVVVNSAAMPVSLMESELFGHERGAFTGAHRVKRGLFEVAHTGTVFIDEIGELDSYSQAKLLRVIEQGDLRRVGSTQVRHIDVRVIAATNRNLEKEVAENRFRDDLFYRLNVLRITVPPLRERREDIPLLANHFLERFYGNGRERRFDDKAMERLKTYDWPGNVRELANIVERATILSSGDVIGGDELSLQFAPLNDAGELTTLDDIIRRHIARTLARTGGNKMQAARVLGIDRRKLYRYIERFGLEQ